MTVEELSALPLRERLKRVRGTKTQKAFAVDLGIEREVYNQIERGKRGIGWTMAERFAKATGLPAELFVTQPGRPDEIAEMNQKLDVLLANMEDVGVRLKKLEDALEEAGWVEAAEDLRARLEQPQEMEAPEARPAPPRTARSRAGRR